MIANSNNNTVRCAIYTRKSTEQGLQQEFSSLDAQREAGQAYIQNRPGDGWCALPTSYDDGGYSGGDLERPALQQLLSDIERGQVDCVLVYKVDRLSRSLLDFARLMEIFQRHEVAFVAVSQDFNTATPMGRLMLHVLLSFAQFEREIISERTRDKLAAARRKGKWLGSRPILGYNADWEASRLVIHEEEAKRVRAIFALYLEAGSLSAALRELRRRGWRNKRSMTRTGTPRGGAPFTKGTLHYLLTNVTYIGQVKYRGEIHPGEQPAIVAKEVFQRVQDLLAENRQQKTPGRRIRLQGSFQGKLFCSNCCAPMAHTFTTKGSRRYRYYVCTKDHGLCATRSVPAGQFERYVFQELRAHFQDSGLPDTTAADLVAFVERIDYDGQLGDLQIRLLKSALAAVGRVG